MMILAFFWVFGVIVAFSHLFGLGWKEALECVLGGFVSAVLVIIFIGIGVVGIAFLFTDLTVPVVMMM